MTPPAPVFPPLLNWLTTRAAGVLLHPTSLPGDFGVGTLDANLDRFLEFLEAAGCKYWQLCPLGPTGYGDSPYQCFSPLGLIETLASHRSEPFSISQSETFKYSRIDFSFVR